MAPLQWVAPETAEKEEVLKIISDDDNDCAFAYDDGNNSNESSNNDNMIGRPREYGAKWEAMFQLLVQYKKKYRTTRVPNTPNSKHTKLGYWVTNQRVNNKRKKLSEYRKQRLESIGFQFKVRAYVSWIEMYNKLRSYKKRNNGSTRVPQTATSLIYSRLGNWVHQQRKSYSNGNLAEERIYLLEHIGFEWQLATYHQPRPWVEMYLRLVAYKAEHNSTNVPCNSKNHHQLGIWARNQRTRCKEEHRIALMDEIGFEW